MDPDLLLPPCQINLPNIKAKEIGDNESYIENNFTEDDLEKSAYNRKIKLKVNPTSKSKEDNHALQHIIQPENNSNERLFGQDKSNHENEDEWLLHKQFLYLSMSSLAKARMFNLVKYESLCDESLEAKFLIKILHHLQWMREKYENGVKLLYEYLIPYNETEETLLGFTSIFEGLERHAKLQIEILNRCDDKLDVELPNEPSKEEIKEESLQGETNDEATIDDHCPPSVLVKLETDGEKELNTIVEEDNELDKNDIVDFAEVSDLDDNLEYNSEIEEDLSSKKGQKKRKRGRPPGRSKTIKTSIDIKAISDENQVLEMKENVNDEWKCDPCKLKFVDKDSLLEHTKLHKPYKCEECNKSFADKNYYKEHKRIHSGESLYDCDQCGDSFGNRQRLKKHYMKHTGEKPYKCDQCFKAFRSASNLKAHIRIHTGEKPFKCDLCSKSFPQKAGLDAHILSHTGEKKFQCDQCCKSYQQKHSLEEHMRSHTGEKRFKCEICFKEFLNYSTLVLHIRRHKGETAYPCTFCTKSYVRKSELQVHLRSHTGEKPFKCDICFKDFTRKDILKRHMNQHHSNTTL